MKHVQYNREPINAKFRLPEPMNMPILTANPTIISHPLHPNDSFLIFASDGLWEHLSNEKAVDIVHSHPRAVRFVVLYFYFFVASLYYAFKLSTLLYIFPLVMHKHLKVNHFCKKSKNCGTFYRYTAVIL